MRKVGRTVYLEYGHDELKTLLKIPKGQIINVAPVNKTTWTVEVDVLNEDGFRLPELKEEEDEEEVIVAQPKKKEVKKETKRLLQEEDEEEAVVEEDEDEF